jgi:hypothetical protein
MSISASNFKAKANPVKRAPTVYINQIVPDENKRSAVIKNMLNLSKTSVSSHGYINKQYSLFYNDEQAP